MAQLSPPLANTDGPPTGSASGSNGATPRDRSSSSPAPSRKKTRVPDGDSSGEDDLSPTSLAKRFLPDATHCATSSSPATTPSTDVASSFELIDVTEVGLETRTLISSAACLRFPKAGILVDVFFLWKRALNLGCGVGLFEYRGGRKERSLSFRARPTTESRLQNAQSNTCWPPCLHVRCALPRPHFAFLFFKVMQITVC